MFIHSMGSIYAWNNSTTVVIVVENSHFNSAPEKLMLALSLIHKNSSLFVMVCPLVDVMGYSNGGGGFLFVFFLMASFDCTQASNLVWFILIVCQGCFYTVLHFSSLLFCPPPPRLECKPNVGRQHRSTGPRWPPVPAPSSTQSS